MHIQERIGADIAMGEAPYWSDFESEPMTHETVRPKAFDEAILDAHIRPSPTWRERLRARLSGVTGLRWGVAMIAALIAAFGITLFVIATRGN